jgi:alkylation response protein AidB-like acyl-CoA dehydrogenase
MSHYKSNVRDIEFNLFEVLGIGSLLDSGAYGDLDADTARNVLEEVARFSEDVIAESFADADRDPVQFDPSTHSISIPAALRKTIMAVQEADWGTIGLPEGIGGVKAPSALLWAIQEMLICANPSAIFFNLGPFMGSVLYDVGTEQQKQWAKKGYEKRWAATMVLTEPDAGSDVGAGRTRAIPQPDGTWHIEGVKRFISGGDVGDTAENVFHLTLARPEGAGPGTKGLSLFYVPNYLFDPETLELGARNGVYVTGVEHKMGLKSSPTCELTYGATDVPAIGYLVGDVHDGIAQMFKVIEHARMLVGTKAIATLSTGYLNALEYAKTRVQGPDLTQAADKTAPRVTITHHPDVRRSLITQKSFAEGMRALILFTASIQDRIAIARAAGTPDEAAGRLNDLLLPIVKGYGSERSWVLLGTESLQTYGGSGYITDYPLEQYVRDAKVDTLYEGTTAIQGQDLFFRKIVRDEGRALGDLSEQITAWLESEAGNGQLKDERELLHQGLEDAGTIVAMMVGDLTTSAKGGDPRQVYLVGLNTTRLLMALGDVICAWLLLRGAEVALQRLNTDLVPAEKAFYEGKVASARWFARTVLPRLAAERAIAETTDLTVMELPEDAF